MAFDCYGSFVRGVDLAFICNIPSLFLSLPYRSVRLRLVTNGLIASNRRSESTCLVSLRTSCPSTFDLSTDSHTLHGNVAHRSFLLKDFSPKAYKVICEMLVSVLDVPTCPWSLAHTRVGRGQGGEDLISDEHNTWKCVAPLLPKAAATILTKLLGSQRRPDRQPWNLSVRQRRDASPARA